MTSRLSLREIVKRYPTVLANDRVSLDVAAGEVHAVLGENGAGKSMLMKVVGGEVRPDAGSIAFDGRPVAIDSPRAARELGIAMVHQHFALFDTLTVAENIALGLGAEMTPARVAERMQELAARYGLDVPPQARVHDLSMGERQRVEILRALLAQPKLLILDEPTSVLTPQAVETLFATLRQLAADGVSVLFISHKLHEIRALATRCTVLRAGRVVATVDPRTETEHGLARLMIGADPPQIAAHETPPAAPRLVVEHLHLPHGKAPLAFTVHSGEILGIAGISGNGQRELMTLLAGEATDAAARITFDGQPIAQLSPRQRRALGLRYVPEERLRHGSVPELSLAENVLLTGDDLRRRGWIRWAAMRRFAARVIELFGVKAGGVEAQARSLSGGNLQKFIVGREIEGVPKMLLIAQPTWGVDVGAAAAIRNALIRLRERGCAVLVVSEDLDELFELCDRIMVMAERRLSPAVPVRDLSVAQVGQWMAGRWEGAAA